MHRTTAQHPLVAEFMAGAQELYKTNRERSELRKLLDVMRRDIAIGRKEKELANEGH